MSCHDHCHSNSCGECCHSEITLTEHERDFLARLAQAPFLPVACFRLKSSHTPHAHLVALAPVFLDSREDSMESVKQTGAVLTSLETYGLITIDYDEPLQNADEGLFRQSKLFAYFEETVRAGSRVPGFLFDVAALEVGSLALTGRGQDVVDQLS